jgi:hypothetical protein
MSRHPAGSTRSISGTNARDGAVKAELRGRTKAGDSKASVGARSERLFNGERQFGEAKLPVFEWSENP